jgi:hypothetical protein
MSKETLEEAAREYWKRGQFGLEKAADTERAFLKGAEWQQERMYSEEEVYNLLCQFPNKEELDNWFEQNKKK